MVVTVSVVELVVEAGALQVTPATSEVQVKPTEPEKLARTIVIGKVAEPPDTTGEGVCPPAYSANALPPVTAGVGMNDGVPLGLKVTSRLGDKRLVSARVC